MTKEQILERNVFDFDDFYNEHVLLTMQEYADQEVAKERERAGKLVEALNKYIDLLEAELEETASFAICHNWVSKRVEQGNESRERIKQALTEYENSNGKHL